MRASRTAHPDARRRAAAGWLVVVLVAGICVVLWGQRDARSQEVPAQVPAGGGAQASDPDVRLGGQVYARQCAVCHGTDGGGRPGGDRLAGPSIDDADIAYVDLVLRTGRMPLLAEEAGVIEERLADREREAVVAWMDEAFDLPGEIPEVGAGSAARGQQLYTRYCAACHGSTGAGGVSAEGTLVRPVRGLEAVAIAEAVRVGPFRMPRFDADVLSQDDVEDVAAYIAQMEQASTTPLGLRELDRVEMTALVVPLVVGMVGIVLLLAQPVRRPETDPDEEPAVGA